MLYLLKNSLLVLFVLLSGTALFAACPQVNASFTASQTSICGPGAQSISFVNTSTGANNGAATYEWFLNGTSFDNTVGLGAPINSNISAVGTYIYMLVATDASVPCTDTATVVVTIYTTPNASFNFNPNNGCAGLPVNFTNTSTGTTGGTTYNWNFGDATNSSASNPNHTYAAGGTFNVTLTQTNGPGCTSSQTQAVTALPIPNVSISGQDGDGDLINCLLPADPSTSQNVTFSNATTGAISYTWDFGDGSPTFTTASNADFVHTYNSYGTFTVTMTATHANGCTFSQTLTVVFEKYVSAAMTLDITEYSGCAPHDLSTLTNLSVNANSYTWNFGDGTIITTTSPTPPTHFYTASGTYTISLTAINSCNSANSTISPIVIVAGPNANFGSNLAGQLGCAPQNVNFNNLSTGTSPANNYQWFMGNGNNYVTTITPPVQTYDTTGVYTITLVAGNACGFDTATLNITIDTIPVADIITNPLDGCSPLVVSTINNSYGIPIAYSWQVDGVFAGNAATLPNQTFINSGGNNPVNHTIQLTVSNHCGNDTDAETVVVHPETIANFSISTDTICEGESIVFTNLSTGENLTYDWDFVIQNETTTGPHSIQFNAAGTYTITLTVDGYCGQDIVQTDIVVLPIPIADFTIVDPILCEGNSTTFINNSTAGGSYLWIFNGGTPIAANTFNSGSISFNNVGAFSVDLTVDVLGCVNTFSDMITINALPDLSFVTLPNNGCSPLDVSTIYFGANAAPDLFEWDFGNGVTSNLINPPNQTYIANNNDSSYVIQLTITTADGCVDSLENFVIVHPLPVADYTPLPDTTCAGTPIGFLNNSTGGSSYLWNFGDGTNSSAISPFHTYNITGDIITELIVYTAFNCTDTISIPIYIDSIPTANFSNTTVCEINPTEFFDLSIGGVTDWSWNFGDGSPIDIAQNPIHQYSNNGTFSVSLTVTNPANCTNTFTQLVNVSEVPVANFSVNSTCLGTVTQFTDLSTGITSSWQWDFGDGSPINNSQNPTHTYASVGTYDVQLISAAGNGCSDTITIQITITPIPTSDFSFINVCTNDTTFFTDLSIGLPDMYQWNFGDGTIDLTNNPNPAHVFTLAGSYNVTLTTGYSISGCTNTISYLVDAFPRTNPSFTTNTPCLGATTQFTDLTGGTPIIWTWNFGDGSPQEIIQNPSHLYTAPGTYSVQLITENGFGCIDTLDQNIQVNPLPTADFTSNVVCLNSNTQFTDLSTGAVAWEWNFGDVTPISSLQSPTHMYATAGTFQVQLVVENIFGCTDTVVQTITVNPNPIADFNFTTACHTYPSIFTDNSTGAIIWTWNFGDGSPTNNNQSPTYIYTNPGNYNVNLLVENIFGCTHSITQNVDVLVQPQADFNYTTVCAGETVQFTDQSLNNPTTYSWDFGDGSALEFNQNPTHIYDPGGNYNLILIVGNPAGCLDTLVTTVNVNTVPIPDFVADTVCLFSISTFTDLTFDPSPIATWYYDFDDGNQSFSQNPNYIFQNAGVYNVTLTVTNIFGCDSSITHPVYVSDIPVADFIADTVCTGNPTTFSDVSTGFPDTWLWNFGDGFSSNVGPVTTHTYALPGTYAVSLFVSVGGACSDQTFEFVVVSDNIQADIISQDTLCDDGIFNFIDNSTIVAGTIDTWFWDFGDGNTSTLEDVNYTYSSPGNYIVNHVVGSAGGCSSSEQINVVVLDNPQSDFIEIPACQNSATLFQDNSNIANGSIASWSWNFGDGTPIDINQNPTHVFSNSGNFNVTLTVTSNFGCTDTYTIPTVVYPAPTALFSAPIACPQDTIQYTDMSTISSGTINQWAWNFGDGQNSTIQNPQHGFVILSDSFNVELIVTSNFGCTDTVVQVVNTYPIPNFAWGPDVSSGCQPLVVNFMDSTTLELGTITNWEYSFGDSTFSFAQNPTHIYSEPGNYNFSLWVTTSDGCTFNSYVDYSIIVYPKPEAGFSPYFTQVSILEPEVQFYDLSNGALDYEWYFGDGNYSNEVNPLHEFNDTGYFDITQIVYSNFGCSDTAINSVYVFGEFSFFIPNCFTPNGDPKNPTWRGYAWGASSYHLMVFNRWGELIFETEDQTVVWDGTYNGVKVPDDVYVWKCVMLDSNLEEHEYVGHVTVLK